jgi:hypothetical protein
MNEGPKIYTSRNKNKHHTKNLGNKKFSDFQICKIRGTNLYELRNKIYTSGNKK